MRIFSLCAVACSLIALNGCVPPPGDDPAAVAANQVPVAAGELTEPEQSSQKADEKIVGMKLGKEDYVAVMADIRCADQHFGDDEAAKTAAHATIMQKAGASEDWLAFVRADLEMEGLVEPMNTKVAEAAAARCPGGALPPDLLQPGAPPPAGESKDGEAPAGDAKDDPKDDPKGDDAKGDEPAGDPE